MRRGTWNGAVALAGCNNDVVVALDFFYDSNTQRSYHDCYTDVDTGVCLPAPPADVPAGLTGGVDVPANENAALHRDVAVSSPALQEGAYLLTTGGQQPQVLYCTGRGILHLTTGRCEVNACGQSTANFVAVDLANAIDGQFCYHTCFYRSA